MPKVFPKEALLVTQPPNVVPPKGNASAQAAILDFLYHLYRSISARQNEILMVAN